MSRKPIVAITMGDPAGVGPEVVLKSLTDSRIRKFTNPLILGDWGVFQRTQGGRRYFPKLVRWEPGEPLVKLLNRPNTVVVCPLSSLRVRDSLPGTPSKAGGQAAYRYIHVAAKLALSGVADAIATAPISKYALKLAGYNYPGHTELLAEMSRTRECRMMLIGKKLRVVLVTGHVAFTNVARGVTRERVYATLDLTHHSLQNFFGISRPRIAVAALNPHGGEEGMFGGEEKNSILPAVRSAQKKGIQVDGPFPSDSLFHRAVQGDFDAVVCMYHDQGLIPLKLHHFFGGVALTLGPPFLRTSVDHGTAYDIAGKGKADPSSMKEAILLAARLARRNMKRKRK